MKILEPWNPGGTEIFFSDSGTTSKGSTDNESYLKSMFPCLLNNKDEHVHHIVCIIFYPLFSTPCTLFIVLYALFSMQCNRAAKNKIETFSYRNPWN